MEVFSKYYSAILRRREGPDKRVIRKSIKMEDALRGALMAAADADRRG